MTRLSVNLNKVALLRNQRDLEVPSVTRMARIAVEAGAHGITVHPRPDERHIRPGDVHALSELVGALPGPVEYNIEGNPFPELLDLLRKLRPAQATLVPDSPEQSTSDRGWTLTRDGQPTESFLRLRPIVRELEELGIRVSLFMDPDPAQIEAAAELGADRVELYTESYARAFGEAGQAASLELYANAARVAAQCELGVNAGHDLNLDNLGLFLSTVPDVLEVSIGHALTADALELGLGAAVRAYLQVISGAIAGKTSDSRVP